LERKQISLLTAETSTDNTTTNLLVSRDGDLASLSGRIDIDSSPAVRDRLLAILNAPHPERVIIDLSSVMHIDSSGVATLIEALKTALAHKTEIKLQGLHTRLLTLFEVTGILALFNGDSNSPQNGKVV
jgi:anti-sigma B factor antagonist